jgi:osomolarity two-component system, sensor histidine kinase NIK1
MATNLTLQARSVVVATRAVAHGDLSHKVEGPFSGEILDIVNTVNDMISRLAIFAAEVISIAREVGAEVKPAEVANIHNTWKMITYVVVI